MKKILIIFLILTGAYVLFFQTNILSFWPLGTQSTQAEVTKNVDLIELDVSGASTNLIPENRDNIEADLEGKGKVIVKKKGDTITVHFKRNWFDGLPFFNKSKINIYIPEEYKKDLEIDISSGQMEFSGPSKNDPMEIDELSLDMSSGRFVLRNLSTNTFELDGSSGSIEIDSLATKKGYFDVSSGNVEVDHYSGEIDGKLSSGNLNVQIDQLVGPIELEVSSGRATIDIPNDADFTLNGEVSSGNIESDLPLEDKEVDKNNIKGTHGSGKHLIDLQVSSGKIEIH
jgi:lia operon protein LiaG